MTQDYQAIVLVSFGGPEGPDDVLPFLENVLRGRNVPRERMLAVAEHYYQFGGKSPINDQNRALMGALRGELATAGHDLPVYWGNRNWHPLLPDTLRDMADAGIERALAFVTSAWGSYSACRQYRDNIADACAEVGERAPQIDKLRAFFNHPGFIEPWIERAAAALAQIPDERRPDTALLFTAHSIPQAMPGMSRYVEQLTEACGLVAAGVDRRDAWELVYQSRSGPPSQSWLEPDVVDRLRELHAAGTRDAVLVPIGFLSDHMEVVYDLDTEALQAADQLELNLIRAATPGTHPRFIRMIRELIEECLDPNQPRLALGKLAPAPDECPVDCCRPNG